MSVARFRAMALALSVLLAACAGNPDSGTTSVTRDRTVAVQVTNNNWSDMVIYVLRDSSRFRLGTVTSFSTAEFEIPYALVGMGSDVHLAADPVGSERAFRTGPIHVQPGQLIDFTVQNHLQVSHYSVWDI